MPVFLRYLLGLGPLNPIAVRLVQNGGKRSRHMYIRSAYLAVLVVVLLWTILAQGGGGGQLSYQRLASAGATSFTYIAFLQITLICVLAPVFMGGAIAQEASPRNWEVLLTTPLTAGQIVLGNLFGRLFFVIALLLCSLPLFAITQYFGGVPGRAIFSSYGVAACAALLVGSIAIALSVSRLVGKRAFFIFYVCVVSYLAVTIAVDLALRRTGQGAGPTGQGVTMMTAANPFLALHALLNPTTYPKAPEGSHAGVARWMLERPVAAWCIGSSIISVLFMIASVITVRAGGLQTLGQGEDGVPLWQRMFGRKVVGQGEGDGAVHRAPRTVWTNPIAWREAASRNSTPSKLAARVAFLLVGGAMGLYWVWMYHSGSFSASMFQFAMLATLYGELLVIGLVAINTAATAISKEREEGTLDLLLTTPITASAYIAGKLRGLIVYLLPMLAVPLGTLLAAGLYVLAGGLGREGGVMVKRTLTSGVVEVPVLLPEAGLLAPLVVVPFMAFCVMVGLHWSLRSRGTLSSTVGTVGVVGVVAGIVGLCAWSAMSRLGYVGPVLGAISPASFLFSCVFPDQGLADALRNGAVLPARIALGIGAIVSALVLSAVCYAIHGNMVRSFDMTVRKLAGNS
jgi:ABC-type transport system involved in multi-copper enzyme maturation permease subunit